MSFQVGRAGDSESRESDIDAVLIGGSLSATDIDADQVEILPPLVRWMLPVAMFHQELLIVCKCGHNDCEGWAGKVPAQVLMGWGSVAAFAGCADVFLESLPVHQRDQATALRAEQAAEVRKAKRL